MRLCYRQIKNSSFPLIDKFVLPSLGFSTRVHWHYPLAPRYGFTRINNMLMTMCINPVIETLKNLHPEVIPHPHAPTILDTAGARR